MCVCVWDILYKIVSTTAVNPKAAPDIVVSKKVEKSIRSCAVQLNYFNFKGNRRLVNGSV